MQVDSIPQSDYLPLELLREIFLFAQSPSLSQVCRRLHNTLATEDMRIRLCKNVILQSFHRECYDNDIAEAVRLDDLRDTLLRQPWFDLEFLGKVEVAVYEDSSYRDLTENYFYSDGTFPKMLTNCRRKAIVPSHLMKVSRTSDQARLVKRLLELGANVLGPDLLARLHHGFDDLRPK